jgi:hypothetical protein
LVVDDPEHHGEHDDGHHAEKVIHVITRIAIVITCIVNHYASIATATPTTTLAATAAVASSTIDPVRSCAENNYNHETKGADTHAHARHNKRHIHTAAATVTVISL